MNESSLNKHSNILSNSIEPFVGGSWNLGKEESFTGRKEG